MGLTGCGGGAPTTPATAPAAAPSVGAPALAAQEVQLAVESAAASVDAAIVIAVTDRTGTPLAVFRKTGAPLMVAGDFGATVDAAEQALALARTAAMFSNDQAPLSSRTVRYISGIHFPPGISFTPSAALYGVENTNRGCPLNVTFLPGKQLAPARSLDGAGTGLGIVTGKRDEFDSDPAAVNPGGVPLYKGGRLVGGIGIAGALPAVAEFAAVSALVGANLAPQPAPPGVVVVDGIALPFVSQTTRPAGVNAGSATGTYVLAPQASSGIVPEGDLIAVTAGTGGLSAQDVRTILDQAAATANITRAVIRLPEGSRARFVIAVADTQGRVLGLHRMADATIFSVDVAVAKARNLAYFSSSSVHPADLPELPRGTAVTNRTIGFGAQPLFPSGIDGTPPGPFFELYRYDRANPCTNGRQPANGNQNGVVFFAGSVPLYKNGMLVGGLGVSGDGVEQDDFVAAAGARGFEPPEQIRADQVEIRGVRLPYLKFPRNPTL